ncbi:MAG: hypothetical protein WGN25_16195 [Candidatus Electrothrix sp. GW3-4]|uniref:hypothetical protein n=1 Tax=Candidatus Electrothrix sp. GW3-4 TaxID=3126740 RepID=UPI0030CDAE90
MEEHKNNITGLKKKEKNIALKKRYEKPQLKTVALFADQVLGGCFEVFPNGTCLQNPRSS